MLKILCLASLALAPLLAWSASALRSDALLAAELTQGDSPFGIDKGADIVGAVVAHQGATYNANLYGAPPLQWTWTISGAQGTDAGTGTTSPTGISIDIPPFSMGQTLTITLNAANGSDSRQVPILP